MEAAEAKIQRVLEGSKQFLVPHYQRPYSWREPQWQALWRDIASLIDDPESKPHFLGPIVSATARSVPEGVEKRLIIDGQQRLTTLLVLLTLIRDRTRELGHSRLADRIQDLVTNRHEEGNDHFKLLPSQGEDARESDREAFVRLVMGERTDSRSGILGAYDWFAARLRVTDPLELEALVRAITTRLTLVSIILDEKDNPHRIFESLNAKGRPLSQVDLIRNYFFMRIHEREHENVHSLVWRPMQRRLGEEALTDFVRHYLMRSGAIIRETDVYSALKASVEEDPAQSPVEHLRTMAKFAAHYEVLIHPAKSPSESIGRRLGRLNRLEVTVAYPFLLSVYDDYASGRLTESAVCSVLDAIEGFVVRRFVVGVPTNALTKIFAPLYAQASRNVDFVPGVRKLLSSRNCPRDTQFREHLGTFRAYGGGGRREKTKFILETLEAALGHKEQIDPATMTIEHVMPQSLTVQWKIELGDTWEEDHEELLHTLGNLTLTGYNSELGNAAFSAKKSYFASSHVEMNSYFGSIERWNAAAIERRAEVLSELAATVWPWFGSIDGEGEESHNSEDVTGTLPRLLRIGEVGRAVESWADVWVQTLEAIALDADDFRHVLTEMPRVLNLNESAFRRTGRARKLSNGAYAQINVSAVGLYRLSTQAAQLAGLADRWSVEFVPVGALEVEHDRPEAAPTQVRQLQLELWTALRPMLAETGKFPRLQSPRAQYWYNVALGRTNVYLSLSANLSEGRLGVRLMLVGERGGRALAALDPERAEIETLIGEALEWNPSPEKKEKSIRVSRPMRLVDRGTWPEALNWLRDKTVAFRDAFAPRIADIDLRPSEADGAPVDPHGQLSPLTE